MRKRFRRAPPFADGGAGNPSIAAQGPYFRFAKPYGQQRCGIPFRFFARSSFTGMKYEAFFIPAAPPEGKRAGKSGAEAEGGGSSSALDRKSYHFFSGKLLSSMPDSPPAASPISTSITYPMTLSFCPDSSA